MKISALLTAVAAATLLFSACKKKESAIVDPPKPGCYITKMTNGNRVISLFYLNNGRVDSTYDYGGSRPVEKKFNWRSGYVMVNYTSNGNFYAYDSITFNSDGYATYIRNYFSPPATYQETVYTYGPGNQLQKIVFMSTGVSQSISYTFTNGNISETVTSGSSVSFNFDHSKDATTGDYFNRFDLLDIGGLKIYNNKNLIIGFTSGNDTSPVSYQFAQDGKISSMTSGLTGTQETWQYEYTCR